MSYASIEEAMIYGYGIERQFRCHVHDDTKPSASVNSVTGLWFCYSCGARGKFNVSDIPADKAATAMIRYLDQISDEPVIYAESYLDVFDSMGPGEYWLSRFSEDVCRRHRLGHDGAGRFATIPVRDETGRILGVTRRDLTGHDPAKYRYPPGVKMSEHMYNYHACKGDVLMLTEGATDAVAATEACWPDVAATYRNGLSLAQAALIVQYAPKAVLVAYDQDDAGESGYRSVRHRLANYMRVDRLTWDTYKDLAAIPLSERSGMLQEVAEAYC